MNNTQEKNDSQEKAKASLRGEAPQEHGGKKRKGKKKNPATEAARQELITMSQQAQDMMKMAEEGLEIEGFEQCEKVNDFLLVMHQHSSGCRTFKTFGEWKKEGFKVKKGSKSYRVWGAPLKAKKTGGEQPAEPVSGEDSKGDAAKTFKYWPMCSLFNESQVEKLDADEGPKQATAQETPATVMPEMEKVKVGEFRGRLEHLERVFNVDRHACVGDREKANWREICERVLSEVERTECPRAKPGDIERRESMVVKVKTFLSNPLTQPEPTEEKPESAEGVGSCDEEALSPFVMVDYQERQEARHERLLNRAEKARKESQAAYARAKDMASVIPFGQPILVGHHSEQRDRRYREKIHNTMGKSVELDKKAEHYRSRADSVGESGISSTDPEAIEKLEKKLAQLVKSQETMKAVNKIIRLKALSKEQKIEKIVDGGLLNTAQAQQIMEKDCFGGIGFASYSLQNNNAEINRTKKRIAELKALRTSAPVEFENDDFSLTVNNGQIVIDFPGGKPNDEVRTLIKGESFKWSRYQTAWVRKATPNAVATARRLLVRLQQLEKIY